LRIGGDLRKRNNSFGIQQQSESFSRKKSVQIEQKIAQLTERHAAQVIALGERHPYIFNNKLNGFDYFFF